MNILIDLAKFPFTLSIQAGFFVGNSENLEYCMFVALLMVTFSQAVCGLVGHESYPGNPSPLHQQIAPLLWLPFVGVGLLVLYKSNKLIWNLMAWSTVITAAMIAIIVIIGAINLDTSKVGMAIQPISTSTNSLPFLASALFPFGAAGILNAVPGAAWFYTGFECISLGKTEEKLHWQEKREVFWAL